MRRYYDSCYSTFLYLYDFNFLPMISCYILMLTLQVNSSLTILNGSAKYLQSRVLVLYATYIQIPQNY